MNSPGKFALDTLLAPLNEWKPNSICLPDEHLPDGYNILPIIDMPKDDRRRGTSAVLYLKKCKFSSEQIMLRMTLQNYTIS